MRPIVSIVQFVLCVCATLAHGAEPGPDEPVEVTAPPDEEQPTEDEPVASPSEPETEPRPAAPPSIEDLPDVLFERPPAHSVRKPAGLRIPPPSERPMRWMVLAGAHLGMGPNEWTRQPRATVSAAHLVGERSGAELWGELTTRVLSGEGGVGFRVGADWLPMRRVNGSGLVLGGGLGLQVHGESYVPRTAGQAGGSAGRVTTVPILVQAGFRANQSGLVLQPTARLVIEPPIAEVRYTAGVSRMPLWDAGFSARIGVQGGIGL